MKLLFRKLLSGRGDGTQLIETIFTTFHGATTWSLAAKRNCKMERVCHKDVSETLVSIERFARWLNAPFKPINSFQYIYYIIYIILVPNTKPLYSSF